MQGKVANLESMVSVHCTVEHVIIISTFCFDTEFASQKRKHSSGIRTAHLPAARIMVTTTRCQYQGVGIPGPMSGRVYIPIPCPLVYLTFTSSGIPNMSSGIPAPTLWYTHPHPLVYPSPPSGIPAPTLWYTHPHPLVYPPPPSALYLPANTVAGSNKVGESSLNSLLRNNQDLSKIKCLIDHPFRSFNTPVPVFWPIQTGCPKSQSCIHCNMTFPPVFFSPFLTLLSITMNVRRSILQCNHGGAIGIYFTTMKEVQWLLNLYHYYSKIIL